MSRKFPLFVSFCLVAGLSSVAIAQRQPILVRPALPPPPPPPAQEGQPGGEQNPDTKFVPDANANPNPASLEVKPEVHAKAQLLVAQLASTKFEERELAGRELAKMGRLAVPALREALVTAEEPEVVLRAEVLLPKAEAEDMKARIASFLADKDGKYEHVLPGWERFNKLVGKDQASREIFAEALKDTLSQRMLLAAERDAVEDASTLLSQFLMPMMTGQYNGQNTATNTGQIVVALFLESCFSDKELRISPPANFGWGGYYTITSYMYNNPEMSKAVNNQKSKYSGVVRNIMIQWIETRETANGLQNAMNFANTFYKDAKERMRFAAKLLTADNGPNGSYMKTNALQQIGNGRGVQYLPQIVKCFDDTYRFHYGAGNSPPFDIEIRDYALAIAIQLTGQKPEDYGMSTVQKDKSKSANFSPQAYHFEDDRPLSERDPNAVMIQRGGIIRGNVVVAADVEEKKEDDKKEEKDEGKEEKKDDDGSKKKPVTQEDRRKAAIEKWKKWAEENVDEKGQWKHNPELKKEDDKEAKPDTPADAPAKEAAPVKRAVAPARPVAPPPVNK